MRRIGFWAAFCALLFTGTCSPKEEPGPFAGQGEGRLGSTADDATPCLALGIPEELDIDANGLTPGQWALEIDGPLAVKVYTDNRVRFSWLASLGIDAVIVEGDFGVRIYRYAPEAQSGEGLTSAIAVTGAPGTLRRIRFCYDHELLVTKTAVTHYTRAYDWHIAKSSLGDSILGLDPGESATMPYHVSVWSTHTDSSFAVTGQITISNPSPHHNAIITSIADVATGGLRLPVQCPRAPPFALAPRATTQCTYGEALPDAADRLNIVRVTTAPWSFVKGGTASAPVVFGAPSDEIDRCVSVDDDPYGPLGEACEDTVFRYELEIGPYGRCGPHRFDNVASFVAEDTHRTGEADASIHVWVACPDRGCTRTPGYWKTHSYHGPAAADPTWNLWPGNADASFFQAGMSVYEALWTPTEGNAYFTLARAYIAARLNQLAGADVSWVLEELAAAEAFFQQYTPADIGALQGHDPARLEALGLAETLDDFNNGLLGEEACKD